MFIGFAAVAWLARQQWFYRAFGFEYHAGFAAANVVPAMLLFALLAGTISFWFSPLVHIWSRRFEYEADAFARATMGEAQPLIQALRKLTEKNLSNLTPHPLYSGFYYSHPTLLEREQRAANSRLSATRVLLSAPRRAHVTASLRCHVERSAATEMRSEPAFKRSLIISRGSGMDRMIRDSSLRSATYRCSQMSRIIVVGAGINGVTAAIELKKRGHEVVLVDPGPLPHPLAASTDISKAVRAAYGADEDYTALAERSIKLWRQWNEEFGTKLYHEVGVMFVRRRKMEPGDFEYESLKLLEKRGLKVARMDTPQLWKRFPAWNPELYRDGVLEIEAGYAESGRAVAMLIERAKSAGVELRERVTFSQLDERGNRVSGIVLDDGQRIAADFVVMAVGAWTPYLLPFTKKFFRATGQPVFHLSLQSLSCLRRSVFRFSAQTLQQPATTDFRSIATAW